MNRGYPRKQRNQVVTAHRFRCCALAVFLAAFTGCTPDAGTRTPVLRIAVTTSTRDTGLLDLLVPNFEQQHGVRVDIVAVGTGAALKLGEAGDVDVVLVHARSAEDEFMSNEHGIRREDVMYNTFEILGPHDDPAGVRDMDPASALQAIASGGHRFVSRGDDSGTHKREQSLWEAGGGRPQWNAYIEGGGGGMGATLTVADQMNAYVLSDRGTYLKFKRKIRLEPLVKSSLAMRNPYGIIVVNPEKRRTVNSDLAATFVDYMISAESQRMIRDLTVEGEPVFYPMHPANSN